jgi:hypothetical protein
MKKNKNTRLKGYNSGNMSPEMFIFRDYNLKPDLSAK